MRIHQSSRERSEVPTCDLCDRDQVEIDGEFHGLCFDHLYRLGRLDAVLDADREESD